MCSRGWGGFLAVNKTPEHLEEEGMYLSPTHRLSVDFCVHVLKRLGGLLVINKTPEHMEEGGTYLGLTRWLSFNYCAHVLWRLGRLS